MDRLARIEAVIQCCSDKKKLALLYKLQRKEQFAEEHMNERAKAYKDAAELVVKIRCQIATGPFQPWAFLNHVEQYLNKQCTAEFTPDWNELRAEEPQQISA